MQDGPLIPDSIPNSIHTKGVLQSKEFISHNNTLIFQKTPDGSQGADVVILRRNKIIQVDGKGMGKDGDRKGAEELADKLSSTDELPGSGTYIMISESEDEVTISGRGGGSALVWLKKDNDAVPKVVYAEQDMEKEFPPTVRTFRKSELVAIATFTDGGPQILMDPEVAVGGNERFKDRLMAEIVRPDMLGTFNIGARSILNNPGLKPAIIEDLRNENLKSLARSKEIYVDDATMVFHVFD